MRSRTRSFEFANTYITATSTTEYTEPTPDAKVIDAKVSTEEDPYVLEEQQRLMILDEFSTQHLSKPVDNVNRPISARRKFIINSLKAGVAPRPSVLIRKYITSNLNVSSQAMGDELAQVLAMSLDSLPALEAINISNNNLTDKGEIKKYQFYNLWL